MKRFLQGISPFVAMIFALLSLTAIPFLFTQCAHSVDVETVGVLVHDTIPGPAFVRFLAMLNNSKTSGIIHLRMTSPQNIDLFADVNPEMRKQFTPIPHDSTILLYAGYFYGTGLQKVDSVTIPLLSPYSLTTIALFRTEDPNDPNRLFAVFADDSVRRLLAPKDSCYIRLINGLPDYPQPSPSVNLYIDDINSQPLFKDNVTGLPSPVNYREIRNYILIPAGNHDIWVRSESDVSQAVRGSQQFVQGQFYTLRLTGSKAEGTAQLTVDIE